MAALDYLTKEVAGAVDRYMSILSHVGYKSYCAVDKLLVYSFIEEILTKFSTAVTEDDYNSMAKALNCAPSLLMGWEDTEDITDDTVSEHIELISKWIRLSPEKQKAVMDIIDALNGEGE